MVTKKTKKKKDQVVEKTYPHLTIGTHLTVIEYEDGSTELIWDDDKLLEEVREATKNAK